MTNDLLFNGCFDLTHPGHFLAIQNISAVRSLYYPDSKLILGLHSNDEIFSKKGTVSVYTDQEKICILNSLKYVDGLLLNIPYTVVTVDWLDSHGISKVIHGNDKVSLNGVDMYGNIGNRYLEIQRTLDISTTDLIDKIIDKTQPSQSSPTS